MPDDPKLLQPEEATYAEPILMPTANKTTTLTPSSVLQAPAPMNGLNTLGGPRCPEGNYATTSPKATLRKMTNHNGNGANVGALFETAPSPCPSGNGVLYGAPFADAATPAFARDPYSSFRSRDNYATGSMRGASGQPGAYGTSSMLAPVDCPAPFATLRSGGNKNPNLNDNYGTARSVKKVYL